MSVHDLRGKLLAGIRERFSHFVENHRLAAVAQVAFAEAKAELSDTKPPEPA